nr:TPA_asm: ATP8 [Marinogammarus marinus]
MAPALWLPMFFIILLTILLNNSMLYFSNYSTPARTVPVLSSLKNTPWPW